MHQRSDAHSDGWTFLMTDTFFVDISRWQSPVTSAYPYPILSFRADSGGSTDGNAAANWAYCKASAGIKVAIGYVVFIPGKRAAILQRVRNLFGPAPGKLVLMIDMESGTGFAGPGDHSTEANALLNDFAGYLGSRDRVIGYANSSDWSHGWPAAPSWLKRITAAYGTRDPGTFGWQYYGGVATYPSPAGYPRSCPPFGSNVDMNVIHQPIADIVAALGLGTTPAAEDTLSAAEVQQIIDHIDDRLPLVRLGKIDTMAYQISEQLAPAIAAIRVKVGAIGTTDALVQAVIAALPASQAGGLTQADVETAVKTVLGGATIEVQP
jgi:hypothetical protein